MADNNKATSLDNVKQYVKGVLQGWIGNKSTLDKFSESQSGELLFDGDVVGSGGGTACDDTSIDVIRQMLIDIFGQQTTWTGDIVSFENGTDAQIKAMLDAHYAGDIDIHDYWNVGDTRTIQLSAMSATGVGETHAAQQVEVVLVNSGGYTMSNGKECAFVWQQKDGLAEPGHMNPTNVNTNGWSGSARKTWCGSVYKQSLPSSFAELLKTCTIRTAQENQTGTLYVDTQDEIFLPSMTEIYGTITDSNNITWTNGYEGNQWDYYKTESNIHNKKMGAVESDNSTRLFYWLRSPDRSNATSFIRVPSWTNNPSAPKGSQASIVTTSTSQFEYHYMIVPCGFI